VAALRAALDEAGGDADTEADRVERIILDGGYADWLAYLRDQRALLERYVDRFGPDALAGHVVDVLWNHYLLALTVPGEEPAAAGDTIVIPAGEITPPGELQAASQPDGPQAGLGRRALALAVIVALSALIVVLVWWGLAR